MGKHMIDAVATVSLEVEARSERAAMERVRELRGGVNPFVILDDGVELYEFTIGDNLPGRMAEYVHDDDDRPGIGTHDIPREPAPEVAPPVSGEPSPKELRELSVLVRRARRAASGDSNDEEIEALQFALDSALRLRFPEIDPDTGKLR